MHIHISSPGFSTMNFARNSLDSSETTGAHQQEGTSSQILVSNRAATSEKLEYFSTVEDGDATVTVDYDAQDYNLRSGRTLDHVADVISNGYETLERMLK